MAAPLGPSVIINQMLAVVGSAKRDYGSVPKQMLFIAPMETVLAIVMFGLFQSYNQKEHDVDMPWVQPLPLWLNALLLPVNLVFSCFLGALLGYANSKYIDWRSTYIYIYICLSVSVPSEPYTNPLPPYI